MRLPRNKKVVGEGWGYTAALPSQFDVYRVDSPFIAAGKRKVFGKDVRKHLPGDTVAAKRVSNGKVRTDPFALSPRNRLAAHRWQFTDGQDNWSSIVRTVRFVDVVARLPGIKLRTPPGTPVDAKADIKTSVPPDLADPRVRLDLVLPWEIGATDLTVHDLIADELTEDDGSLDETMMAAIVDQFSEELPREQTLDWEMWIGNDYVVVEPGESVFSTIEIRGTQPGRLALAVLAVNADDDNDRAASEIVVVDVDEDGTVSLLYADGEDC